jgi:hypothetical protein
MRIFTPLRWPAVFWKRIGIVRNLMESRPTIAIHELPRRANHKEHNKGTDKQSQNPKPRPEPGIIRMPIRSASTEGHVSLQSFFVNARRRASVPGDAA